MPRTRLFRLFALAATLSLSSCIDDDVQTPVDPGAEISMGVDVGAMALEAGDPFILLATTRGGKLIEIDVTGGSARLIGQTIPFGSPPWAPQWTGITVVDDQILTSSRDVDDPRDDNCRPFFGSGKACTHIYEIDPGTGHALQDFGTTDVRDIYDIDAADDGTIYGSFSMRIGTNDGVNFFPMADQAGRPLASAAITAGDLGWLTTTDGGVATIAPGPFSTPGNTLDGGYFFVEGGLSVAPDGTIWVAESEFRWTSIGPRLITVDPTTGAATSAVPIRVNGAVPAFGFAALEITPDGRFFASRSNAIGSTPFEIYELDPVTGTATKLALDVGGLVNERISGMEAVDAPIPTTFTVTTAEAELDETGLPGADELRLDFDFVLGDDSNGLDLENEAVGLVIGSTSFNLPAGSFSAVAGGYEYTSSGPGLTLIQVSEANGTVHVEGEGLTLARLLLGAVDVSIQLGDDSGSSSVAFTFPSGVPPRPQQTFYGSTSAGEIVIVDLASGTMTALETRADVGWTGLSFRRDGTLFTIARFRDGDPVADDCFGGEFTEFQPRCTHLYRVDSGTGAVIEDVGSTGIKYLSDIEFGPGDVLFGNEFINQRQLRDGGLVKIDETTAEVVQEFSMGTIDFVVANGGMAMDPRDGQLYLVEATGDQSFSRLLKVDDVTGLASDPVTFRLNGQILDFGFSGLEITANGHFYANRAGGSQEIYRINPDNGEVRLQLVTPIGVNGALTGLDSFREAAPPAPRADDVIDTFIRKDKDKSEKSKKSKKSKKSNKSAKSNKSGKSNKSNKSGKSNKSAKSKKSGKGGSSSLTAGETGTAGFTSNGGGHRGNYRDANEGANPRLELSDEKRVLLDFDLGDFDPASVTRATLILTLDASTEVDGGRIHAHRLKRDFVEGNGVNTGPEEQRYMGDGTGATWRCSADTDIGNDKRDCSRSDRWSGGDFAWWSSADVRVRNGDTGSVEFDLTEDVRNGVTAWLLRSGNADLAFVSREGADLLGDFTVTPRLVVETGN